MTSQESLDRIAREVTTVATLLIELIEKRRLMDAQQVENAVELSDQIVTDGGILDRADKPDARGQALRDFQAEGGLV